MSSFTMSSSIDLECVGSEVLKLSRSLSLQFHSKSTFPLSKVLLILLRARTTKQASTYLLYTEAISQVCNIIILRRANNLAEPVVEKPMWFYPLNPCQMPNFKLNPFNLVPPNTRRRPNNIPLFEKRADDKTPNKFPVFSFITETTQAN